VRFRWKVEKFHQETKQLTGLEGSQCRKARIVRSQLVVPIWFGYGSKQAAIDTQRTIYLVKHVLLDDYSCQQLKSPTVQVRLVLVLQIF